MTDELLAARQKGWIYCSIKCGGYSTPRLGALKTKITVFQSFDFKGIRIAATGQSIAGKKPNGRPFYNFSQLFSLTGEWEGGDLFTNPAAQPALNITQASLLGRNIDPRHVLTVHRSIYDFNSCIRDELSKNDVRSISPHVKNVSVLTGAKLDPVPRQLLPLADRTMGRGLVAGYGIE